MSKYKVESIEHLIKAFEVNIKTHKRIIAELSDDPDYSTEYNEGFIAACEYAIRLAKALQEAQSTRLAAAAPELLHMLKVVNDVLYDVVSGDGVIGGEDKIVKQAKQVIAHAEEEGAK